MPDFYEIAEINVMGEKACKSSVNMQKSMSFF